MAGRVAQLSLFGVALLIGALLVGQLRSQARPIELANLSPQELSTLIETLSARNAELRDGLALLSPRLVPPNDLVKALFQRIKIEWALHSYRRRNVVSRTAGFQLIEEPKSLLGK